jgi:chorismate-pyruvate lyase
VSTERHPFLDSSVEDPFTAQARRPSALVPICGGVGPLMRVALTLDGTLTTLLEVLAQEAIHAAALPSESGDTFGLLGELALDGEAVRTRDVLLRGQGTRFDYVAARSLLVPARAPGGFLETLSAEPGGIGRALVRTRTETMRELLWCGRLPKSAAPSLPTDLEAPLCRAYRVVYRGAPIACIHEIFLVDLDERFR